MLARLTLSICFAVIAIAHIAGIWLGLYRLATISLVLACLAAHLASRVRAQRTVGVTRGLLQASPIYLYAMLSTLWSPDPQMALRDAAYTTIAVVPAIVLGVTLARRYSGLQTAQGFGFLVLPFAFQAIYSAFEYGDTMMIEEGTMRTVLANVICLVSPVLAGAWAVSRRRRYAFFGLVATILAVTMGSRSVVLFAAPAALVSLYLQDRRLAKRILKLWTIPLIAIVLASSPILLARFGSEATSFDISEAVIDELQRPPEDRVDVDRRLTTFTAAVMFLENPIFGRGYSSILQTHQDAYGIELSAHGLVPGTLSELGLAGMAIIAFVIWKATSGGLRTARSQQARDPMLIHFIVGFWSLLFLGAFHQTIESVFFALILGFLIGLRPQEALCRKSMTLLRRVAATRELYKS